MKKKSASPRRSGSRLGEASGEARVGRAGGPILPILKKTFTPPSRTPWGGRLIAKLPAFKGKTSDKIIGEAWVISGHKSFPSIPKIRLPFLVKLLNSANKKNANLSVQIHPPRGYKRSDPPKTEAWVILQAKKGSGIHVGLKKGVTKKRMEKDLKTGRDITKHLNFVKTRPGDVFFIPAGTPHAIGKGQFLLEAQETSESTYRYYDYGRKDAAGKTRELHIEDALNVTNWRAPRGKKCIENLRRKPVLIGKRRNGRAKVYSLVDEKEFSLQKIELKKRDKYIQTVKQGIEGYVVTAGSAVVISSMGRKFGPFKKGQAFVIPAGMNRYVIMRASMREPAVIYKTSAGRLPA